MKEKEEEKMTALPHISPFHAFFFFFIYNFLYYPRKVFMSSPLSSRLLSSLLVSPFRLSFSLCLFFPLVCYPFISLIFYASPFCLLCFSKIIKQPFLFPLHPLSFILSTLTLTFRLLCRVISSSFLYPSRLYFPPTLFHHQRAIPLPIPFPFYFFPFP